MPVSAVLLDLDNTLYPYPPCDEAGRTAARETANDRGLDLSRDAFTEFYEAGRRAVKRDLSGTGASHDRLLYFRAALEQRIGEPRPRDAMALADAYWDAYLDAMELFPGVMETLETLAARTAVAVTTDLTTRIQLRKVARLDLADHLDALVTSEAVGRDKPASAMFTVPLARLDVPPRDAVMVGDDPEADIAGANAAGLTTVLFNGTYDPDLHPPEAEPDHTIAAFPDLLEVLDR